MLKSDKKVIAHGYYRCPIFHDMVEYTVIFLPSGFYELIYGYYHYFEIALNGIDKYLYSSYSIPFTLYESLGDIEKVLGFKLDIS
jgi:hypothetical protein